MPTLTYTWKEFSIPTDRLAVIVKAMLSSNYDGMVCREEDFDLVFIEDPSQSDQDIFDTFWSTVTLAQFNPSLKEIVSQKINEASAFGRALILDVAVTNVQMGITQSGKTRAVADFCRVVQRYLESGSLYAAVDELTDYINAGAPAELAPFITNDRLTATRARILEFLEI